MTNTESETCTVFLGSLTPKFQQILPMRQKALILLLSPCLSLPFLDSLIEINILQKSWITYLPSASLGGPPSFFFFPQEGIKSRWKSEIQKLSCCIFEAKENVHFFLSLESQFAL